jgi:hypothetical protein
VDVSLVKKQTDDFAKRLDQVKVKIQKNFEELGFRRDFSALLMMLFVGLAIGFWLLSKNPKEKKERK